jgi:competence protein ComEA
MEASLRDWLIRSGIPVVVAIVFALAITVISAGQQAQPSIEVRAPALQPTPTALLYVHVAGGVAAPGVYALPSGSHVFEAIAAAGGANEDADPDALNLASRVADGQKLVVPLRRAQGELASAPVPSSPASGAPAQAAASGATINVNTASQKMLESLPGVGPVTATKILARRDTVGPFSRIEQLKDEKIVNASTFERIKARISVD